MEVSTLYKSIIDHISLHHLPTSSCLLRAHSQSLLQGGFSARIRNQTTACFLTPTPASCKRTARINK